MFDFLKPSLSDLVFVAVFSTAVTIFLKKEKKKWLFVISFFLTGGLNILLALALTYSAIFLACGFKEAAAPFFITLGAFGLEACVVYLLSLPQKGG
jgi:hypothetical protein